MLQNPYEELDNAKRNLVTGVYASNRNPLKENHPLYHLREIFVDSVYTTRLIILALIYIGDCIRYLKR